MKIINKKDGIYYVQGSTSVHEVTLNPINCTCPDYKFRKFKTGELCKHIKYVTEFATDLVKENHNI